MNEQPPTYGQPPNYGGPPGYGQQPNHGQPYGQQPNYGQPMYGGPPPGQKRSSAPIIIGLVVLVLVVLGGGAAALMLGKSKRGATVAQTTTASSAATSASADTTAAAPAGDPTTVKTADIGSWSTYESKDGSLCGAATYYGDGPVLTVNWQGHTNSVFVYVDAADLNTISDFRQDGRLPIRVALSADNKAVGEWTDANAKEGFTAAGVRSLEIEGPIATLDQLAGATNLTVFSGAQQVTSLNMSDTRAMADHLHACDTRWRQRQG